MLLGEDEHRQKCRLPVISWKRQHCEFRNKLALELLAFPQATGGVHEGLERNRYSAEVRRRSQDEPVLLDKFIRSAGDFLVGALIGLDVDIEDVGA